ncbi:hypothetical protein QC762_0065980 [Podospora pseudocomata]|uniref:Uncharacterized protein n=1 Tax=Podospora pseudocomata TaxID=2093779 RepID=A0ABR0GFP2_9PEZI|nr:hypothetical protein QC762_0065980 [Podospora pseudocomata]
MECSFYMSKHPTTSTMAATAHSAMPGFGGPPGGGPGPAGGPKWSSSSDEPRARYIFADFHIQMEHFVSETSRQDGRNEDTVGR